MASSDAAAGTATAGGGGEARWRMRNQVGDKVRWYQEPEQEHPGGE